MNTIQIKGKLPFFFGKLHWPVNKKIKVASAWDELSQKQLYIIADVLHSKTLLIEGKIRLAVALLGVKMRMFLRFTASQVHDILPITEFILEENKLTKNLISYLKVGSQRFYGPANLLANITIEEFGFADTFYTRYKESKKEEWLCRLFAALYRPQKADYDPKSDSYKGDIREDFNRHLVFNRARRFAKLKDNRKYAIFLFYEGCRKEIIQKHPHVFSKKKPTGKSFGWGGILVELAGNKFGDHEQTKKANLFDVLGHLEMEAIKANKFKEEQEKLRRKYVKR